MNSTQAQETIIECCEIIDKITEKRAEILEKQEKSQGQLDKLNKDLGQALVRAMFGTEIPAEVNLIRKEIRDIEKSFNDFPLILTALDLLELEKKEQKKDPQQIIRNFAEDERQRKLNMSLQQQLLKMAAESENFMHKPEFLNIVEKFKRNARSLDQEQAADDFLRTLRG